MYIEKVLAQGQTLKATCEKDAFLAIFKTRHTINAKNKVVKN